MTDKVKPTEAEVQAWLDGVHFSSSCNLPLVSKEELDETDKAPHQKHDSETVVKNKS